MKKLPCKTIVWQKLWGKRPSGISRWWFLIVYFYQHMCKAEPLCLATLCKVCKATQATPALVPEAWALWNEGSDSHQHSTLCSGLWAYPNTDWQHWHRTLGSVFWPTLVSKLGFTQVLSQLSQAAPTFADADLLLCSGTKCKPPALREFHMLSCPCLFSLIL